MKKVSLILSIIFVLLLGACSADYEMDNNLDQDPNYDDESPNDESPSLDDLLPEVENVSLNNQPAQINRKMIFTAEIGLTTPSPEEAYEDIIDALVTYDAFVEEESYSNNVYSLKLRVLTENYQDYITYIRSLGHTGHFKTEAEDVTNTYSTLEARLDALNTQHDRILELLETAVDMDDIIELEDKLASIESELNQIGDSLTNYDSLIEYSTISLVITEIDTFDLLLPKTALPMVNDFDITSSSIAFNTTNYDDISKQITASLYLDGELVETIEVDLMPNASKTISFDDLNPSQEYYLSLYASRENYQDSELYTKRSIETNSTFLSTMWLTLIASFNILGTILRFMILSVIALSPFALIGIIIFIPVKLLIKKHKKIHKLAPKDINL
ncbi:MAG: DUF4349 domain-containing protein [Candidatus Izemoplasmataceae bacterium]